MSDHFVKAGYSGSKKLMRYTFEKYGKPTWFIDRLIYTYPLYMAIAFNTPFLVYGENISHEYGGSGGKKPTLLNVSWKMELLLILTLVNLWMVPV